MKWLEHSKYKLRVKSVASIELMSFQLSNLGRWLLGKDTTRNLRVLRVSPMEEEVCVLTTEGDEADFRLKYEDIFTGVGKLRDFLLKLHVKGNVTPVVQSVRMLRFGLRRLVRIWMNYKLKILLRKYRSAQQNSH